VQAGEFTTEDSRETALGQQLSENQKGGLDQGTSRFPHTGEWWPKKIRKTKKRKGELTDYFGNVENMFYESRGDPDGNPYNRDKKNCWGGEGYY